MPSVRRLVQSSPGQDDHTRKIVEQCLHEYRHEQQNLSRRVALMENELSRLSASLGTRDEIAQFVDVTGARAKVCKDSRSSTLFDDDGSAHASFETTEHQYARLERGPHEQSIQESQMRPLPRQADGSELPESMFSYCMWDVTRSSEPWQSQGMLYLVFSTTLQHILFVGFSGSAILADMKFHWHHRDDSSVCMYGAYTDGEWATLGASKIIWGQPWPVLLTGLSVMLVVGLFLHAHYSELLGIVYPENHGCAIKCVVMYMLFLEFVYFPTNLAVNLATLVADCHDSMQMILCCVGVTFVRDVDTILYRAVLRSSEKNAYTKSSLHSEDARVGSLAWLATLIDVVGMAVVFLATRFVGLTGEQFYNWSNGSRKPIPIVWLGLFCAHGAFLARAIRVKGKQLASLGNENRAIGCLALTFDLIVGSAAGCCSGVLYWITITQIGGSGFSSLTLLHSCYD